MERNKICLRILLVISFLYFSSWLSATLYSVSYRRSAGSAHPLNISTNGLVFLKTHKSASSTVSRILFRVLCEKAKLKCFLPDATHAGKTWNLDAAKDWKFISEKMPYDAWLHHLVFSNKIYRVVPHANKLLSICRRPAQRFASAWYWYNHESTTRISLASFVDDSAMYATSLRPIGLSFAINFCNSFKYRTGLDATSSELTGTSTFLQMMLFPFKFRYLISSIYSRDFFVLVADRLDESLVVLAKALNWKLSHVLYKSHKVSAQTIQSVNHQTGKGAALDADQLLALDALQPYDLTLYEAANFMLDRYIEEYNLELFQRDVENLRRGLLRLDEFCNSSFINEVSSSSRFHAEAMARRDMVRENLDANKAMDLPQWLREAKIPFASSGVASARIRHQHVSSQVLTTSGIANSDQSITLYCEPSDSVCLSDGVRRCFSLLDSPTTGPGMHSRYDSKASLRVSHFSGGASAEPKDDAVLVPCRAAGARMCASLKKDNREAIEDMHARMQSSRVYQSVEEKLLLPDNLQASHPAESAQPIVSEALLNAVEELILESFLWD